MLLATSRICAKPVSFKTKRSNARVRVEERRNALRRKNTPAIRRNTRKGNRARICFYIRIFLKNFNSKPFSTIDAGSRV